MKRIPFVLLALLLVTLATMVSQRTVKAVRAQSAVGSIEGYVSLSGRAPGNRVIRMGADPKCAQVNRGKLVIQESVMTNLEGDLADVFIHLEGDFPPTPVPSESVTIDQKDCIYRPRVVGARVGQVVEISNSDDWLHNVHSSSRGNNSFNVGQPRAGLVYRFLPKDVELMVDLGCDLHRWMTAYIGVLDHPHFSVTGETGEFEILGVPVGTYTIQAWHEIYGELTETVRVGAGTTARVEFTYAAD